MNFKNTTVNANENSIFIGEAYYGQDCAGGSKIKRLKYQDAVKALIEKYWNSPYKALPQSRQYTFVELRLVVEFDFADRYYNPSSERIYAEHRMLSLDMIADALKISPLVLYNDPELPLYLRP